jgi:hypothetical protein
MSGWGVDWMSVANGSKNLVEELDHAFYPYFNKTPSPEAHLGVEAANSYKVFPAF